MTTKENARENARSAWWNCTLGADWHGESDAFRAGWNAAITKRDTEIKQLKEKVARLELETGYHAMEDTIKLLTFERDALRTQRDTLMEVLWERLSHKGDCDWFDKGICTCGSVDAALVAGKGEQ